MSNNTYFAVKVQYRDGKTDMFERVSDFSISTEARFFKLNVNGYYIFINADDVLLIGRHFDIVNPYEASR